MKIVNPIFLYQFLYPLMGLGDDDEAMKYYLDIDLCTEEQYKVIIRENLVDDFNHLNEEIKEKAKLALSYYLSKPEIDFDRVFDSLLPPCDLPENSRDFFVWLWEELYGDESYKISEFEIFKVVEDIYEPLRLSLKKG